MCFENKKEMKKAVTLPHKPKVCLIVLNWMNYDLCSSLLHDFRSLSYRNIDVVLVDNGSPDGSGKRLSQDFPEIVYVPLKDNMGYAVGNNAGMRLALERGADFVFLLNFDLTILTCQIIERMVFCFQSISELGILNPLILFGNPSSGMNNQQFRRGVYFHAIQRMLAPIMGFRQILKNGAILEKRPFAHGSAMMISRKCLERIGFLNEEFFMYMVEPEYCFRSRKNGFLTMVLLDEQACVVHHGEIAQKSWKTFFYARNQFLFLRLFCFCRQMLFFIVFFGSLVERMIHFIRKREPLSAFYHVTGFCSGLRIWMRDLIGWSKPGQYLLEEKIRFQRFRRRH
jgi:GT2 family glycosyltransferase